MDLILKRAFQETLSYQLFCTPKAMHPSLKKTVTTLQEGRPSTILCQSVVERPGAAPLNEQKHAAQQHCPVGAAIVQHGPETIIGQQVGFGRGNGNQHNDKQGDTGQAGK